jgi:hypothetical protein
MLFAYTGEEPFNSPLAKNGRTAGKDAVKPTGYEKECVLI